MKITTSSIAKHTATFTKIATAGALAGALFMAAPNKAQAQVGFGVHIGGPVVYGHVGPVYGGPVYGPRFYGRPYPVYRGYYGYRPYDRFHRYGWR